MKKAMKKIKDKNYLYFVKNFKQITNNHLSEFVVIKDCSIQGYFDNIDTAIQTMLDKGFEFGTFIVQLCTESVDTIQSTYYTPYFKSVL